MDSNIDPLIEVLFECTVRILADRGNGSGFFVGPGTILTCAHVIKDSETIDINHNGNKYSAEIIKILAQPYPDLALLKIKYKDHISVFLDPDLQRNDDIYGIGYQSEFHGGEGIPGKYAAPSYFDNTRTQELIKFSDALVISGFSGGPLLNLRTGAVCGVIKRTLGEDAAVGGRAVPIDIAISEFGLTTYKDPRWLEAQSLQIKKGLDQKTQTSKQDVSLFDKQNNRNQYARDRLFGRDELINTVNSRLDENKRILLYGLAASGKTVLAATIAAQRLKTNKGNYLWLKLKPSMQDDDVLDALIRQLATGKEQEKLLSVSLNAKIQSLDNLMNRSDVKLWIIDDAPKGVLKTVLRASPDHVGVLITSRTVFSTGPNIDEADEAIEVGVISQDAALEMLVILANRPDLRRNPLTKSLLQILGFHPYSIEIACRQLSNKPGKDIKELLEMIEDAPHDLEMPGDFAEHGRESMKKLLDAVVYSLKTPTGDTDKDEKNANLLTLFRALGAFFASGATIDLLSTYLHQPTRKTIYTLDDMAEISLARREPGTRFYDIHDLVFSYARALWKKESGGNYSASLAAIIAFLEANKDQPSLLASDIDNLLAAARYVQKDNSDVFLKIVSGLALSGYMDNHGHTEILQILDDAIKVAGTKKDTDTLHYLLSKQGNAYFFQQKILDAESCYREALRLAPDGDWYRKMVLEAVLGKTYTYLKNSSRASEYFEYSEATLNDHNTLDEKNDYLTGRLFILEQQYVAAYFREDYIKGHELTQKGLALIDESKVQLPEELTLFRNTLGTLELLLGATKGLENHKQALEAAPSIDNQQVLATVYYGLAMDYLVIDKFAQAREYFRKAKRLYEEYGNLEKLNQLKALTWVFDERGE